MRKWRSRRGGGVHGKEFVNDDGALVSFGGEFDGVGIFLEVASG